MRVLAIAAVALLVPAAARAAPGDLDRAFGDGGAVLGERGPAATVVRVFPDKRVVVQWEGGALASFTAGGQRIAAFPPLPADLAAPAGGGIAVLRMTDDVDRHVTLERVDASGQPVTAAVPVAHASRDDWRPEALLAAGDATIVVGRLDKRDGTTAVTVGRLTAAGAPDPGFGAVVLHDRDEPAAALRPDGGLDLAVATLRRGVRLVSLPDGRDRRIRVGRGLAPVALHRDRHGRLLLALSDRRRGAIVRLLHGGGLDRRFRRLRFGGAVTALARDRRGRILVATRERGLATVRRFDRDGAPDAAFGRAVLRRPGWADSSATSLLADRTGRVLVAGSAGDRPLLVRLHG